MINCLTFHYVYINKLITNNYKSYFNIESIMDYNFNGL